MLKRCGLSLLAAAVVFSQVGCATLVTAREEFRHEFAWQSYDKLVVRSLNGRVELAPDPAAKAVSVTGSKHAGGVSMNEAQTNLEQLEVVAHPDSADPRTLVVELQYPSELRNRSIGASLKVLTPASCAADIATGNGSVDVRGMKQTIAQTSNGHVALADIAGDVDARTSNGRITAERIAGRGRLDTSNGRVVVHTINACDIETSNGSVEVTDARGDVRVETSNGGIVCQASPGAEGRVDLVASNGTIQITTPPGMRGQIDLNTSNGRLDRDMGDATLRHAKWSRDRFEAEMNGGGNGRVLARTTNGSIRYEAR